MDANISSRSTETYRRLTPIRTVRTTHPTNRSEPIRHIHHASSASLGACKAVSDMVCSDVASPARPGVLGPRTTAGHSLTPATTIIMLVKRS